ncbi:MAG: hypothetical protein H6719_06710 [Sandaracinaceae bacterium]|nr:hypothetical protein [Sandaracinaceae bacterium]
MIVAKRTLITLAALLVLSACGGFRLDPPAPARPIVIAGFEVVYSPEIPGDRQRLLDRTGVRAEMQRVLRLSYPAGAGPMVRVIITQFRSGRWGPTRMHATAQVLDPQGNVLAQIEADSTTVNGASRGSLIRTVSQDCVNQIARQL